MLAGLGVVVAGVAVPLEPAVAQTNLGNTSYSQDVTWTVAGSPYVISGQVTVGSGATLTVEPGWWSSSTGSSAA